MTTAPALLQDLAGRGVVLMADAGKLRYRAPAGTLTPDLRRQLEAHKAALVALLTSDQQAGLFDAIPAQDLTKPDIDQEPGAATIVKQRETTRQTPASNPVIQERTGNAGALVAGSGQDLAQDAAPRVRPIDQDFRRLRHDVLDMAAELDQLLADLGRAPGQGLEFARPGHAAHATWLRFCALDSQWARLAPVAEYATFEELEEATGAAYLAAVANPSDQDLARTYARLDDALAAVLALPEVQP